jgi:hypothetical protein
MSMSIWVIISWVLVAILTAANIVFFLKLKKASEQMLKMAFPGAKNMNEALTQMQSMARNVGMGAGRRRGAGGGSDVQLRAAMEMLKNLQEKGPKR